MRDATKKLEAVANIAIVLIAMIFGGVFISKYLGWTPRQLPPENIIKNGTKLAMPGVIWSATNKSLVMALSTKCHFCADSMAFYQRLTAKKTEQDNLRFLVVMPQSTNDAKDYLVAKNIKVDEVRQMKLSDINVAGTPTLILVDDNGVVLESWVGRLSPEKESEVFSRIYGDRASL